MKQIAKESKSQGKRPILCASDAAPSAGRSLRSDVADVLASVREGRLARVADHVANDLHDPKSGRLDARRIAEYLQVSLACIASAVGKEAALVRRSPAADSIQEGLAPVARTVAILAPFLGSRQQVRAWLHNPHPDLGGQSPMSLIQAGKAEAVADMLDAALAGQPL